jgi:hypothetical protein
MHKLVGFFLVMSVSLYSTPLRADSYDNHPEMFADENNVNADTSCDVIPATTHGQPENGILEQNANDSSLSETPEIYTDSGNYTDQESLVTPENNDQTKRGHYKYWQNILLAVAVVAVAVTALLLVNSHQGHKSHDHSK